MLELPQILLGWFIADVLVGLFHWWQDRVARTDMPFIGESIIVPNRLHHSDPLAFTRSGLLHRNLPTWIVVGLVSAVWALTLGPSITWAAATAGALLVNEIHVTAHIPSRANWLIRWLWRTGLLQTPEQHALHHAGPRARTYLMLTNVLNPLVDSTRVWDGLERGLTLIGLEPNRGTA